jgi:hypothetical protein
LVAASKASGRSLSQEIEHRLARTFRDDKDIDRVFGNARNFAMMRLIASTADGLRKPNKKEGWLDDPDLFELAVQAIQTVLMLYKPPGERSPESLTDPEDSLFPNLAGVEAAMTMAREIWAADPSLPLNKGTSAQHTAIAIKGHLGDVADRPNAIKREKAGKRITK